MPQTLPAVAEAHSAALAPFVQPDGGDRMGATFGWLLARA